MIDYFSYTFFYCCCSIMQMLSKLHLFMSPVLFPSQLKRAAKESQLKGSTLEDAITVAITAMNEPKTCSTTSLRKYLVDSNKDVKENLLGKFLSVHVHSPQLA